MEEILDNIGNILTILEDAISEKEWELVTDAKDELDELYEQLDKRLEKFGDYD